MSRDMSHSELRMRKTRSRLVVVQALRRKMLQEVDDVLPISVGSNSQTHRRALFRSAFGASASHVTVTRDLQRTSMHQQRVTSHSVTMSNSKAVSHSAYDQLECNGTSPVGLNNNNMMNKPPHAMVQEGDQEGCDTRYRSSVKLVFPPNSPAMTLESRSRATDLSSPRLIGHAATQKNCVTKHAELNCDLGSADLNNNNKHIACNKSTVSHRNVPISIQSQVIGNKTTKTLDKGAYEQRAPLVVRVVLPKTGQLISRGSRPETDTPSQAQKPTTHLKSSTASSSNINSQRLASTVSNTVIHLGAAPRRTVRTEQYAAMEGQTLKASEDVKKKLARDCILRKLKGVTPPAGNAHKEHRHEYVKFQPNIHSPPADMKVINFAKADWSDQGKRTEAKISVEPKETPKIRQASTSRKGSESSDVIKSATFTASNSNLDKLIPHGGDSTTKSTPDNNVSTICHAVSQESNQRLDEKTSEKGEHAGRAIVHSDETKSHCSAMASTEVDVMTSCSKMLTADDIASYQCRFASDPVNFHKVLRIPSMGDGEYDETVTDFFTGAGQRIPLQIEVTERKPCTDKLAINSDSELYKSNDKANEKPPEQVNKFVPDVQVVVAEDVPTSDNQSKESRKISESTAVTTDDFNSMRTDDRMQIPGSNTGSPVIEKPAKRENDVSSRIPRFYFPCGQPRPTDEIKSTLTKISEAFGKIGKDRVTRRELGSIILSCGYSEYWKAAFFKAATKSDADTVSKSDVIAMWSRLAKSNHDDASRFVKMLAKPGNNFLEFDDFLCLMQDIVECHPGLTFLREAPEFHTRYMNTVIARIFYVVNRSWSGQITVSELRRSNFLTVLSSLEEEEDINAVTEYFSYEHFYVVYCKFWELDTDHDLVIDKLDLTRHANGALSSRLIDRVLCGAVTRWDSSDHRNGKMSYVDFVWFLISEEDKKSSTSLEYWFRCMDLDGDGVISMYEMEFFYEEQMRKLEQLDIEPLPFEDCVCQMLDMVKPLHRDRITLKDLKNCKMANVFFDTFFNVEKYLDHEQKDPFAPQKDVDSIVAEPSDWEKFAADEYEILVAEEQANEQGSFDMNYDDDVDPLIEEELRNLGIGLGAKDAHVTTAVQRSRDENRDENPDAMEQTSFLSDAQQRLKT
uniref:Uncharacterized protein LOC100176266 n=1 Tax=Phallusia mammillata TaxID=59560 RepID=A0A6F9DH61_9ASCI|nr:uncharacterized protein LOC100176266 [Phallusia mammillata]